MSRRNSRVKFFLACCLFAAMAAFFEVSPLPAQNVESRPDLVLADFEADNYSNWSVEGEAFGNMPAAGTLPNQMTVSGFEGKRLVNSYHGGDDTTGKLTSPEFKIERKYIVFLIGGGGYKDETCMRLLVDGREVCQATGDNVAPGGSEMLDWKSWDVSQFQGKTAKIEIIDNRKGSWGHINVDQITMSDKSRETTTLSRAILVQKSCLHLPVKTGNPKKWMQLLVDGKVAREFEIELALPGQTPDFHATLEIAPWRGKAIELRAEKLPSDSTVLQTVTESDEISDTATMYQEKLRPIFHFTARRGWINDPNGLLYYDGKYHLFCQHNPFGVNWGNMTWLHSVSDDLVHWTELSDALHPDALGTIFSGSGVVDHDNTSGFQTGKEKPLVLIFTSAGGTNRWSEGQPFTQSIAYSNDGGKTWHKYENNPVLKHVKGGNRDPKVFWHKPSHQWVMALYLDGEDYALFGSPNLKEWSKLCDIEKLGCSECPDMFELAVDGNPDNKKWVFWGGNGVYLIGTFDGKMFVPESKPLQAKYGGQDYAAQTWSDIPESDGRRIQISWLNDWGTQGKFFPDMPFNMQYSLPRELTLRTTKHGIRLFTEPAREVETLRQPLTLAVRNENVVLHETKPYQIDAPDEALEIEAVIDIKTAKQITVGVPGYSLKYDVAEQKLGPAPLEPVDGRIKLRMFVDRSSFEVFANDGLVQFATCFPPEAVQTKNISVAVDGGTATIESIRVYPLRSIW